MKTTFLKISVFALLLILSETGCKKEEVLPPNTAKGKIIAVTGNCYGEVVLIEIENPKGIGVSGNFTTVGNDIDISYKNAIGVPYFNKIGLSASIPQTIGTSLYFEYRELSTEELNNSSLFEPDPPPLCMAIYGPPSCMRLIITKIF